MLRDVMDALAQQLRDNLDQSEVTLHIEGRAFLAAETPAVDMLIGNATGLEAGLAGFHQLYGGVPITIRVRVSPADSYAGEDLLLDLMDGDGGLSILAALDADHTLGGVVDDLMWGDGFPWTGFEDFPDVNGDGTFLGSTLPLVVVPKSS